MTYADLELAEKENAVKYDKEKVLLLLQYRNDFGQGVRQQNFEELQRKTALEHRHFTSTTQNQRWKRLLTLIHPSLTGPLE